jgi:hypothetical protein
MLRSDAPAIESDAASAKLQVPLAPIRGALEIVALFQFQRLLARARRRTHMPLATLTRGLRGTGPLHRYTIVTLSGPCATARTRSRLITFGRCQSIHPSSTLERIQRAVRQGPRNTHFGLRPASVGVEKMEWNAVSAACAAD